MSLGIRFSIQIPVGNLPVNGIHEKTLMVLEHMAPNLTPGNRDVTSHRGLATSSVYTQNRQLGKIHDMGFLRLI